MKVTRRQRGVLILLLVAVVVLAADKLLLPGPDAAQAAGQVAVAGDIPQTPAGEGPDHLLAAAAPPEPAAAWSGQPVEDVFDLARLSGIDVSSRAPRDGQLEEPTGAAFTRRHALRATILGPRPVAQVGKKMLSVGDSLDGWVLESISEREAVFVSDEGQVVLRVTRRRGP